MPANEKDFWDKFIPWFRDFILNIPKKVLEQFPVNFKDIFANVEIVPALKGNNVSIDLKHETVAKMCLLAWQERPQAGVEFFVAKATITITNAHLLVGVSSLVPEKAARKPSIVPALTQHTKTFKGAKPPAIFDKAQFLKELYEYIECNSALKKQGGIKEIYSILLPYVREESFCLLNSNPSCNTIFSEVRSLLSSGLRQQKGWHLGLQEKDRELIEKQAKRTDDACEFFFAQGMKIGLDVPNASVRTLSR